MPRFFSLSCVFFTFIISGIAIAVSIPLLLRAPTSMQEKIDNVELISKSIYLHDNNNKIKNKNLLSVMSFNIRLDSWESNPDNHFTKRVSRLRNVIQKYKPGLIGVQEPFGPQVHHLLSVLNEKVKSEDNENDDGNKRQESRHVVYKAIGYNREGFTDDELLHPSRHNDFHAAILYRPDLLELLERDFLWMKKATPGDIGTDRWGNIARFRIKNFAKKNMNKIGNDGSDEVILFNTHLCVRWELARRKHAAILLGEMKKWKQRYPNASLFLTGDFNSAPGQSSHRTLLGRILDGDVAKFNQGHDFAEDDPNTMKQIFSDASAPSNLSLSDAWETCSAQSSCIQNNIAFTFHGWLGATLADCYLTRLLGRVLLTLHGMQFKLPLSPPLSLKDWARAARDFFTRMPEFGVLESIPSSWTRYHVDWILHEATKAEVLTIFVADLRDVEFSSDHFAIVGQFELK